MLRNAVKRFGDDLHRISDSIKSKATSQIKSNIKKRSYESARISLDRVPASSSNNIIESSLATSTMPDSLTGQSVESEVEVS